MASLKRAIENSLDSVSAGGDGDERLAEIREIDNAAKRASLLAVHSMVTRFPEMTASRLGLTYQPPGLVRLDSGRQSDVYREDPASDTVLKIVKEQDEDFNPIILTARERKNFAAQMREEHTAMAAYVGAPVMPHEIKIGRHPIQRDRQVIRITQPYCEVDLLELADDEDDTTALRERLQKAQGLYPNTIADVSEIFIGSMAMLHDRELVTDIVGPNAGVDRRTGSVVIFDSQPVPPKRTGDHQLAIRHLDRLGVALGALAI